MDWMRLCSEATSLRPDEVGALERRLETDPDDVEARVQLIGSLFLGPIEERSPRRGEHLLWLATHRPDIRLGGLSTLVAEYAPREHAALVAAWRAAVADPDVGTDILNNAATYLGFEDPAEGEALYRRAAAKEPDSPKWQSEIAHKMMMQAGRTEDDALAKRLALGAVVALDAALDRTTSSSSALGVRISLLKSLVLAEQWERAAETAERVLVDNERESRSWQTGNGIHDAEITLGWCCHARGDLATAGAHLLRAGATPGSPQLNSFGPDFELARVLLRAGERDVVRKYLVACRVFWSSGERHLDAWLAELDRGETTDLPSRYDRDESGG